MLELENYQERLSGTVGKLCNPKSYELVYHRPQLNEDMLSVKAIEEIVEIIREIIFPGYFGNDAIRAETITYHIGVSTDRLYKLMVMQLRRGYCFACEQCNNTDCDKCACDAPAIAMKFIELLPEIREKLAKDVHSMYLYDPAAKGYGEIIFAYPAIKALTHYRVAHALHLLKVPIIPRIISEMAHSLTGIDIHPGATIGENFVIDHGTGVVIGETCIIGNNVRLYQGVTLGARSFKLDDGGNPIKGIARHPIVEDDVIIYSGATILGRITVGKGSVVGGNVWVTNDLPPDSKVVQSRPRENMYYDGAGI